MLITASKFLTKDVNEFKAKDVNESAMANFGAHASSVVAHASTRAQNLLVALGVHRDAAEQLERLGIRSVERLLSADLPRLVSRKGAALAPVQYAGGSGQATVGLSTFDLPALERAQNELVTSMSAPAESAAYLRRADSMFGKTLSTGAASLDLLLGGGFRTGELTELVGPSSSGKTQVCHAAAAAAAAAGAFPARAPSAPSTTVLYIDTCHSFSPTRAAEMIGSRQLSAEARSEALTRIRCLRARDAFELVEILDGLWQRLDALCGGGGEVAGGADVEGTDRGDGGDHGSSSGGGGCGRTLGSTYAKETQNNGDDHQGHEGGERGGEREENEKEREEAWLRDLRLVIVDPAAALLAPLLSSGSAGRAMAAQVAGLMRRLARTFHVALLCTSHTVEVRQSATLAGDANDGRGNRGSSSSACGTGQIGSLGFLHGSKAALGVSWRYAASTILHLSPAAAKADGGEAAALCDQRQRLVVAALEKSPREPEAAGRRALIALGPSGVTSVRVL